MYWRIGGVEHYVLNLETEAKEGVARPRPRSATFSGTQPSTVGVTRWASSPCRQLLAGATAQGVYLWSHKPFAQLSSLVYETTEFGRIADLIWAPSGDTLFVILSRGYIYELSVQRRGDRVLEYVFATQHYFARGPGEEAGIGGVGLAQRRTFRLPDTNSEVVCAGAAQYAMVATKSHVYRMTWAGALKSSSTVSEAYGRDGDVVVVQMGVLEDTDMEYFVFSDGSVRIVGKIDDSEESADSTETVGDNVQTLDGLDATALDFSAASMMMAVGTATGTVYLYALEEKQLHRVGRADGSGRVHALRWAPDGTAVACVHATGHIVMRTLLGREVNSTRVGDVEFVAWGAGARVFGSGARGAWGLGFARAMSNAGSSVSLFSDDMVLVQARGVDEGAVWRVEHVAASYSGVNAPIRVAACSADGRVVVAGARGMAVSTGHGRWRLQRAARERTVEYTALAWSGSHVVAACVDHGRNMARLEFWMGGRALDAPAASIDLDAPAVVVSAHGSAVLVLSERGVLSEYALAVGGAQVELRRTVDVAACGVDARRVREVMWAPGACGDSGAALVVVQGAQLRVVHDGRASNVGRAERVSISSVNIGSMHSAVWWYDGAQVLAAPVSLDDFMAYGTRALDRGPSVHLALDFYPLVIAADHGMVIGLDQDMGNTPLLRGTLFLPALLSHMLHTSEPDALMYAASFEHRRFFAHAMEKLLHEALVNDMRLDRTVRMLAHFAQFDDIVVHCARKTEAAFWPRLFEWVGGAAHLFVRCLNNGRLRTAAQSLLVLQTMEPPDVAARCVVQLLARAARAKSFGLCTEVLRFVRATSVSDTEMHALYVRLK
ncbi:WD40 repeat protein [Coemansia sp. RSA 2131]|nr:WD40 repeat protein [Coemansia sp. RSA 2131]